MCVCECVHLCMCAFVSVCICLCAELDVTSVRLAIKLHNIILLSTMYKAVFPSVCMSVFVIKRISAVAA